MRTTPRKTLNRAVFIVGCLLMVAGVVVACLDDVDVEGTASDTLGFGFVWDHELHASHSDITCTTCHHKTASGEAASGAQTHHVACDSADCHPRHPSSAARIDEEAVVGQRRALHTKCAGCHGAMSQGPTDCVGCHQANRGTEACLSCHQGVREKMVSHESVACAACHTTLEGRTSDEGHQGAVPPAEAKAQCLDCHGDAEDAAGFPVRRFERRGVSDELFLDIGCPECRPSPHG